MWPKAFGESLLMEDMSFSLPPGGIVGVIGPNGAGKTTFQMITGQEKPDSGIRIGETVKLAYVDQSRDLDPEKTIWEEISGGNDQIELGNGWSTPGPMWPGSIFPARTSRKKWAFSPAVSATGFTWPRC